MKTNGWVASSQHLYRWLLHLYPHAYRTNYAEEMFHLFTDQCRAAHTQRGAWGILALWLRTLSDLGVTVVREHLSDPNSKAGLLDAVPGLPLPWKGVLLVLIPGLIFFISQVEQLTSTRDWFFYVCYRAGFFLILPALLVWLLVRRFPVWGLIPLGLLYATLVNYANFPYLQALPVIGRFFANDTLVLAGMKISSYSLKNLLLASLCLVSLGLLIWYSARRGWISRNAWKWLGLGGLLIVVRIAVEAYAISQEYSPQESLKARLFDNVVWNLYDPLPFLLLVFFGVIAARKYGGFAFLILLGYLLPTIVFGRYGAWTDYLPFYMVSLSVLIYRFVVALVAPVWLVRAASRPGRQRAVAIPVGIAIACQIFLNLMVGLAWNTQYGSSAHLLDFALYIWHQLILAVGLGLAIALYLPRQLDQDAVPPPALITASR